MRASSMISAASKKRDFFWKKIKNETSARDLSAEFSKVYTELFAFE